MITQLLYTSVSRYHRGHPSDIDILQHALSHNRPSEITGYLLRDLRSFCQLIEGLEQKVEALFRRISMDPLHYDVVTRMRRAVPKRAFLGWSMGYGSLSQKDSDFLSKRFAEGPRGTLVAFNRIGRLAAGGAA